MVQSLGKQFGSSSNPKCRVMLPPGSFTSRCTPKRRETGPNRNLYMNVYNSIIKLVAIIAQMFIS